MDGFREDESVTFVLARATSSVAGLVVRLVVRGSGLVAQGFGLEPAGSYTAWIE